MAHDSWVRQVDMTLCLPASHRVPAAPSGGSSKLRRNKQKTLGFFTGEGGHPARRKWTLCLRHHCPVAHHPGRGEDTNPAFVISQGPSELSASMQRK